MLPTNMMSVIAIGKSGRKLLFTGGAGQSGLKKEKVAKKWFFASRFHNSPPQTYIIGDKMRLPSHREV